jgi:hypothetical protein
MDLLTIVRAAIGFHVKLKIRGLDFACFPFYALSNADFHW